MFYDERVEINAAVDAIEQFLATYEGVGEHHVRPSGDDVDVIKVWIEVKTPDPKAFAHKCEQAIRAKVPGAARYRLAVRAEAGTS